jgi:hypothetical protein
MSACPSILPHGKTQVALDVFSVNLILEDYLKRLLRKANAYENPTEMKGP